MHLKSLISLGVAVAVAGCQSYLTNPGDSPPPPPPSAPPAVPAGLWAGSGSPAAILRLAPAQLTDSGRRIPATVLVTPSAPLNTLIGLAFDARGNLWVTSADDSLVLEFAAEDLAKKAPLVARTVIRSVDGSLAAPTALAFDRQHRLWVANHESGTLVRFDSAQLSRGGAQTPAVIIEGARHPTALAFDRDGTLWVSDNQVWRVFGYSSAQLATSGRPLPGVVINRIATSMIEPAGLAFDPAGNLWVANLGGNTIVSFTPAQLAVGGALAPNVVLARNGGSLAVPVGLAFDGDGSLWVVGTAGTLTQFSRTSLAASGAPAPSAHLTVTGQSVLWSAAFWPRPAGLPIN